MQQLQRSTETIDDCRLDRHRQTDAVDRSGMAVAGTCRPVGDDREPFDRAQPSRSRTIRCDPVSDRIGRQRMMMQRSQSASRIHCQSSTSSSDSTDASSPKDATLLEESEFGGSRRFRKRLDAIRDSLLSRVARKRSDGGTRGKDADCRHHEGPAAVRQSEAVPSDADRSPVDAPSPAAASSPSPFTSVFDRHRVHRRTPRRHRTVAVGEQVATTAAAAEGPSLRRNASAGSSCTARDVRRQKLDDVIRDDAGRRHVTSDVTSVSSDANSNDDAQQSPQLTR